jgi:hypothetical protein
MKKILAVILATALVVPVISFAAAETKKVCVDIQGKDGKPVVDAKTKKPKQDCKTIKLHKKHEGTAIPEKKK